MWQIQETQNGFQGRITVTNDFGEDMIFTTGIYLKRIKAEHAATELDREIELQVQQQTATGYSKWAF